MKAAVFMLINQFINRSLNGQAQDEIIKMFIVNVLIVCKSATHPDNYGSLIRGRGVSTFQSFSKKWIQSPFKKMFGQQS